MLTYESIKGKPKSFRSFTGFDKIEFEAMLKPFNVAWASYIQKTFIDDKDRQRAYGAGRKPILDKIEDKLLFVLFYYKNYPLQEVLGFMFGMSQAQANEWVHKLSQVLKMALGEEKFLPERKPSNMMDILESCKDLSFIIDGVERRIQRPKDQKKQKECYSGKKKAHTIKNNIIGGTKSKKVIFLSETYEGKIHDKKICDVESYQFPEGSVLFKDLGFQGFEPENTITYQPKKKPKGKSLSLEDKLSNAMISSIRVIVEHVIAGIKRLHIVKYIFRNTKNNFDDLVMEVACGLHNARVEWRVPPLSQVGLTMH